MGVFFKCLGDTLALAAILTNRDSFVSPMHFEQEAGVTKNSWTSSDFRSDVLAVLKAHNAWREMRRRLDYAAANWFCSENFLSEPALLMIQNTQVYLLQSLYHAGVIDVTIVPPELDINRESTPLLVALIAVANRPNFAIRMGERSYRTPQNKVLRSILFNFSDPLTRPRLL